MNEEKRPVLLHTCCANCAAACIEQLMEEHHDVALFYTNSNIDTEEEFNRRRDDVRRLAQLTGTPLYEDKYRHDLWLKAVKGFENEPERGKRCRHCFEFNLARTAEQAGKLLFPCFTTTLSVSPHKTSRMIFEIGQYMKGFLPIDFKKNGGFKRSIELSKEHGFYRQDYCGCEFSRKD